MSDRQVIRCPHCNLRQFMTANTLCRKCTKPLLRPVSGACIDDASEPTTITCIPQQQITEEMRDPVVVMVATRLKIARKHRGFSHRELAHAYGSSRTYFSKIEHFQVVPSISSLKRICICLDFPLHLLFGPPNDFAAFFKVEKV
jgi:ribosome-binding protein aMBF1 (putative translation factor)